MNDHFRLKECCVREHLIQWTVSKIMFRQIRILSRQRAGQSRVRIPTEVRDFSVLQNVQTNFGAQPFIKLVEWKRNLMAHGDAREEKWRGKRRMERVASSFQLDSEQSIQCYYNRSPPTRTPRKPVLDWTDIPADINGLVRFAGRPNLVSALVPSHPVFTLPRFIPWGRAAETEAYESR